MFNENLMNLIRSKYPGCMKPGISFKPVYYPDIPEKQAEKAKKHFVETTQEDETILMLFDTSLFGKGKNGLALTDRAVYFRDAIGSTNICAYKDWRIGVDDAAKLLQISNANVFLLSASLNGLLNEICALKKDEGLFDAEEQKVKEAQQKAAEAAAQEAAKASDSEDSDDEDSDDEGGGSLLDILGVMMDVTDDPSRK